MPNHLGLDKEKVGQMWPRLGYLIKKLKSQLITDLILIR